MAQEKRGMLTKSALRIVSQKKFEKDRSLDIDTDAPIHEIIATIDSIIAEKTLSGKTSIFRQDGRLVAIVQPEDGPLKIIPVTVDFFPVCVSPFIRFFVWRTPNGKPAYKDYLRACPQDIVKSFLATEGASKIPALKGVINTPTLRADGTIIEENGYDQESGLFLSLKDVFPKVLENPTHEQAEEALTRLKLILKDFPFENGASESVILAGFLTAVVRRSLPSAPAIGITAPTMGTGKSMLTDLMAIMATGQRAQCTSFAFDEGEVVKKLLASLMAGLPVLAIDNIESHVRSASLCTILTQPTYTARILGVSKEATVQTNTMVILNGNNLVIRGDMTTRVVLCSLDSGEERPQERKFEIKPIAYMVKNRAQMVTDALTIMRAYIVSGGRVDVTEYGRFEAWSRFVREPLIWLGRADPLDTVKEVEKNDPVRVAHALVLTALSELYGDKTFQAKDAVKVYGSGNSKQLQLRQAAYDALESAVQSLKGLNARTCGILFRQMEKRVYNGMRLIRAGQYQGTETWRVEHINDNSGGSGQIKPTRES